MQLSRRGLLGSLPAFGAAVALSGRLNAAPLDGQTITFLHFNDIYEIAPKDDRGGFAALMTLLKGERAKAPWSITTFGGDLLSPSLLSGVLKGAQMVDLMNAVAVDIAVPGNHEYDFGAAIAVERFAASKFPWICSNVFTADATTIAPGLAASGIRQIGDYKIGFFGLLTPEAARLTFGARDYTFRPPVEVAREQVKALRDAGADMIVALTHLDIADDLRVARQVRGIDLILGGHDHVPITYLESGTLIFKAGMDGYWLGAIDVNLRRVAAKDGTRVVATPLSWRLTATDGVAGDPDIAAKVDGYNAELDRSMAVAIGVTRTELDSRRDTVRAHEAAIGNLITDAMRTHVDAEAAITNGGGIRANRVYPPGTQLTRKDIVSELPFGNVVMLLALTGTQIREALENGVSQVADKGGRFPQVSGIRFTYDASRERGQRVTEVAVAGSPLDPARSYKVAVNDFMQVGGDGYTVLKEGKVLIDASGATLLANAVISYIEARKDVAPVVEGRIVEQH